MQDSAMQNEQAINTQMVSIPVEGMTCVSCVASVTQTTKGIEGVRDVEVDLAERRARVEYVADQTSPEQIAAAIAGLGYRTGTPVPENE